LGTRFSTEAGEILSQAPEGDRRVPGGTPTGRFPGAPGNWQYSAYGILQVVAWEVEFTDEFRDWWDALSEEQ
jgi:hypothetical protein